MEHNTISIKMLRTLYILFYNVNLKNVRNYLYTEKTT